jgi:hypothetical protein
MGQVVATLFLGAAFLAMSISGRGHTWFVLGLGLAVTTLFVVTRDGLEMARIVAGPISGSLALGGLLLGSFLWAEVVGLPRSLARRLGIGVRIRLLPFDKRLTELRHRSVEATDRAGERPSQRAEALAEAEAQLDRVRDLRAPDAEWAKLRDDLLDADEAWIALVRANVPADEVSAQMGVYPPLLARWEALRERRRRDWLAGAEPELHRRQNISWTMTFGLAALLVGFGTARSSGFPALHPEDINLWLGASCIVGGIGLVAYSLRMAIRR